MQQYTRVCIKYLLSGYTADLLQMTTFVMHINAVLMTKYGPVL